MGTSALRGIRTWRDRDWKSDTTSDCSIDWRVHRNALGLGSARSLVSALRIFGRSGSGIGSRMDGKSDLGTLRSHRIEHHCSFRLSDWIHRGS